MTLHSPPLSLAFSLRFEDLYDSGGLAKLDAHFLEALRREDAGLADRLAAARSNPDSLGPKPEAELLLYLADRAQHVARVVRPAIERGAIVVADRFSDSTIAYQAHGRGLPLPTVRAIDDFARAGVAPLVTFVLDIEPAAGLARARAPGPADRLESEELAFHRRVREGFHAIAASAPERVVVLDATLPVDDLADEIARVALERLDRR